MVRFRVSLRALGAVLVLGAAFLLCDCGFSSASPFYSQGTRFLFACGEVEGDGEGRGPAGGPEGRPAGRAIAGIAEGDRAWVRAFDSDRAALAIGPSGETTVELTPEPEAKRWVGSLDLSSVSGIVSFLAVMEDKEGRVLYRGLEPCVTVTGDSTPAISLAAQDHFDSGDIGPAGGWIFHDAGSYAALPAEGGFRYLEAARADAGSLAWGDAAYSAAATASEIGSGLANTAAVVTVMPALTECAARACDGFQDNGMSDWFLPARYGLYGMYSSLASLDLGGFQDAQYWSSTRRTASSAYANCIDFATGTTLLSGALSDAKRVRPARRF